MVFAVAGEDVDDGVIFVVLCLLCRKTGEQVLVVRQGDDPDLASFGRRRRSLTKTPFALRADART